MFGVEQQHGFVSAGSVAASVAEEEMAGGAALQHHG